VHRGGLALHLGEVLLVHPVGGVGESLGQVAVVREEQQPLGVEVQSAHGEDPGLGGDELEHGGATLGVEAVVTTPAGLFSA